MDIVDINQINSDRWAAFWASLDNPDDADMKEECDIARAKWISTCIQHPIIAAEFYNQYATKEDMVGDIYGDRQGGDI